MKNGALILPSIFSRSQRCNANRVKDFKFDGFQNCSIFHDNPQYLYQENPRKMICFSDIRKGPERWLNLKKVQDLVKSHKIPQNFFLIQIYKENSPKIQNMILLQGLILHRDIHILEAFRIKKMVLDAIYSYKQQSGASQEGNSPETLDQLRGVIGAAPEPSNWLRRRGRSCPHHSPHSTDVAPSFPPSNIKSGLQIKFWARSK